MVADTWVRRAEWRGSALVAPQPGAYAACAKVTQRFSASLPVLDRVVMAVRSSYEG
jgi:hypothetical protein